MRDRPLITEHHISTTRTARYAQLGDSRGAVREVWMVCHGYGQLASRFARRFAPLADGTRLIVAPEALSRFYVGGGHGPHAADHKVGASWLTYEDRDAEIEDQIEFLDAVAGRVFSEVDRGAVRLILLGFSQGASTASRWLLRGAFEADALVLWGGGMPRDVIHAADHTRLASAPLTIVAGEQDPVATSERAAEHLAGLDAAGFTYELLRYAGGHEVEEGALLRLAGVLKERC